jgi:hypothetical protein
MALPATAIAVCERKADQAGCGNAEKSGAGVHHLTGLSIGIVGGHATDSGRKEDSCGDDSNEGFVHAAYDAVDDSSIQPLTPNLEAHAVGGGGVDGPGG